jgi:uncharacterized protein (TIGR02145 family)
MAPCTPSAITADPNPTAQSNLQGTAFTALSVTATGSTPLFYQWYSNTSNDNISGTLISGATSASYTPLSAAVGALYYYCVVTNACGIDTSNVSGLHTVTAPAVPPVITVHPSTAARSNPQNTAFAALSVTATGTAPLSYQWYSNTANNNTSGVLIAGATSATYQVPSNVIGAKYYYCIVSNVAGTATSNVSGLHTVYAAIPAPATTGCDAATPNWGASLGTVSFASTKEWVIGNQTWSDAVRASVCNNRTTAYWIKNTTVVSADCRNNPYATGHLFSWCAVVRYYNVLCPAPWRVPTRSDFYNLWMNIRAAKGSSQADYPSTWISFWGGSGTSGHCTNLGSIVDNGMVGNYWSQTSRNTTVAYYLLLSTGFNTVVPEQESNGDKYFGKMLRCVK